MRRFIVRTAVLAPLMLHAAAACAFTIVPSGGGYFVVIDTALGDHVPFSALPPGYQRLTGSGWFENGLAFRWTYFRSTEQGEATIAFDEDGRATIRFVFAGDDLADGDTIAAAAVLVDDAGGAMHTLFGSAKVEGAGFAGGESRQDVAALVDLSPDGWAAVTGITFFTMKYYAQQTPDEAGLVEAMRRAVGRVTDGRGGEQWIGDLTP